MEHREAKTAEPSRPPGGNAEGTRNGSYKAKT